MARNVIIHTEYSSVQTVYLFAFYRVCSGTESCELSTLPADDSQRGEPGWILHQLHTGWHDMWQQGDRFVKQGIKPRHKSNNMNHFSLLYVCAPTQPAEIYN